MRTAPITTIRLLGPHRPDVAVLRREFPTVGVVIGGDARVVHDGAEWARALDFKPFDEAVDRSADATIAVRGDADVACEILTRYQRHVRRRNDASAAPVFDAVLAAHAALHDVGKPLVRADLDHALDTWQWLLRLAPHASLAVQLAALFHDVERLVSEADRRVEHHAPDYQAFKDAHARAGAVMAREALVSAGVESPVAARAHALVASHERRGGDPELALLADADALSFFSLNSPGYADYFGVEQTRRKIAYTLGRASARARAHLRRVRLRADVASMVAEQVAA